MAAEAKPLRTDVYDQLKERLFNGQLRSGQFVSQRELTALLGATLNPVREAIRQLETEGLINVYPQRGIQVVEGSPKAINDAYDYRLLIERDAVRRLAEVADAGELASLEAAVRASIEKLKTSPDSQSVRIEVLDDDYKFHRELVDFQGNGIISKHYRLNAARLRLFRIRLGEPLQRLELAAKEHLHILAAVRSRKPDLAIQLLSTHIGISREHTLGIRPMRS